MADPKDMTEAEKTVQFCDADKSADLVTVVDFDGPVQAKAITKMINATVGLLEAIAKDQGKSRIVWALTEVAVIGSKCSYTVRGYPSELLKKLKQQEKKGPTNATT